MIPRRRPFDAINFASAINFPAGFWLIASPWVFGRAAIDAGAWSSVVVGVAIAGVAVLRSAAGPRLAILSWLNVLLGAWTIASPWIFSYVDQAARSWNSGVLGLLVVVIACVAETAPEAWGERDEDYQPTPGWDYPYSVTPERPGEPAVWYTSTDYGRAGLGASEREDASGSWRRWLLGRSG